MENRKFDAEKMLRALGPTAFETAEKLAESGAVCPYDKDVSVSVQFHERGNCARCFVVQCPINA